MKKQTNKKMNKKMKEASKMLSDYNEEKKRLSLIRDLEDKYVIKDVDSGEREYLVNPLSENSAQNLFSPMVFICLGAIFSLIILSLVLLIFKPIDAYSFSQGYNQSIADNNQTFYMQGMNDTMNYFDITLKTNAANCQNLTIVYPEYQNQQLHYVVWECLGK